MQLGKQTWKVVPLPGGKKPVNSKWVFMNKTDARGNVSRKRGRLVEKGFTQRYGIDFEEVFSPVAKYSTVRFMLAFAAQQDLDVLQLDFKSAFLNGELDEEIYLVHYARYVSSKFPNHVYRLLSALYGLKQASRAWHKMIDAYLLSIGGRCSERDSTMFVLIVGGTTVFILVYVGDILLIGKRMKVLRTVAQQIGSRFEIRIEPSISKFLGIIIERCREKGDLKLHARPMMEHLFRIFGMQQCRQVSSPLPPSIGLERCDPIVIKNHQQGSPSTGSMLDRYCT